VTATLPRLCDLSPVNALLRISGDDAAEFLHNQFTNDVKALAVGAAQWNGWCTPKGRLLVTFVLARDAEGYFLLLPSEFAQAIAKRLRMFVLRSRVLVEDVSAATPRFGLWDGAIPAGAFPLAKHAPSCSATRRKAAQRRWTTGRSPSSAPASCRSYPARRRSSSRRWPTTS